MKTLVRHRIVLAAGILLGAQQQHAAAFAPSSDPDAARMARGIVEHLGGAQRWSRAKGLYVREAAHMRSNPAIVSSEYWRSFEAANWWGRSVDASGKAHRLYAILERDGWTLRDGVLASRTPEQQQQDIGWWPQEIYVMYHRFAKDDPLLRLSKTGDFSFKVLDHASGRLLGDFEVDGEGQLVRWRNSFGLASVEYLYGEPRRFADIALPGWGSLIDGTFRFEYVEARLLEQAPRAPFERPGKVQP